MAEVIALATESDGYQGWRCEVCGGKTGYDQPINFGEALKIVKEFRELHAGCIVNEHRVHLDLEGITRTKGGWKVKELFYIAATKDKPKPGIIGRCWRHGAYRDMIWNEDTGRSIYGSAFDIELPTAPIVARTRFTSCGACQGAGESFGKECSTCEGTCVVDQTEQKGGEAK